MAKQTRTSHHAHRLCRLLAKLAIANEIGPEACWMLCLIAHTEDARHYAGAVTYWNDQLRNVCGFGSVGRLVRARQRAIDAGWLIYTPGGKRRAGKYETRIPQEYQDIPDGAIDESPGPSPICESIPDTKADLMRDYSGSKADLMRAPSNPNPYPLPNPKKGAPPVAIDLTALVGEISSNLDTPQFSQAWSLWIQHRKELGSKQALKPTQARSQLKMLAKLGPEAAIAMIEHTIEKGWVGLRAPDNQKGKTDGRSQTNRGPGSSRA